jgi:hypothetical protein
MNAPTLAPSLLGPVPMTSAPSPARWSHAGAVGTAFSDNAGDPKDAREATGRPDRSAADAERRPGSLIAPR